MIEELPSSNPVGVVKTLNHEIQLFKAGEVNHEGVINLWMKEGADPEKISSESLRRIQENRWWLWEYWERKGLPKEQVELDDGEHQITLYNYGEPIDRAHLDLINRILGIFSGIRGGLVFNDVRYILLDDVQGMNDKSGEPTNGYGPINSLAVTLYPNAFRPISNRVTDRITNLEGTLAHELTHGIPNQLIDGEMVLNLWIKAVGWDMADERRVLPGGAISIWKTDFSKCVTDYAKSDPDEDICESMVAALFDPEKLDPNRLTTLQRTLPLDPSKQTTWSSRQVREVCLPETPTDFKVRFKGSPGIFTVISKEGDG